MTSTTTTETAVSPSISLPSALRPARVSVQATSRDATTPASNGTSSEPLSALQSFYGSLPRRGSGQSTGLPIQSTRMSNTPSSGTGTIPSILPNSAFLSPRKPSAIAARGRPSVSSQSQQGRGSPSGFDNASTLGSSTMALSNSQQSQTYSNNGHTTATGSMYLVEAGNNTASQDFLKSRSSFSHTSHQQYPDGQQHNTLSRNGSLNQHNRAESRQETLASRTSRDPLIYRSVQEEGANYAAGQQALPSRTSMSSSRPEHGKRKNSKTGSITSLLGFGGSKQSQQGDYNRAYIPEREKRKSQSSTAGGRVSLAPPSMPPLREVNSEKSQSHREARQDMNGYLDNSDGHYAQAHISIPVISDKTHQPLRNYQIYKEKQRLSRSPPDPNKRSFLSKILNRRPPNAIQYSEQQGTPFGYGTDNLGGNNRFLLSGRLVTSGDSPYPFLASFAVAVFMPAIFLAFEAEWLCSSSSSSSSGSTTSSGVGSFGNSGGIALLVIFIYVILIMYASMLRTALRDPGIIPKGLDREPDFESFAVPVGGSEDLTGTGMGQRPKLRMVKVRDEIVGSKWCETCQTYRPPRTSHCRLCDVCIEQTDHHCSFLNNCIGRRNYPSFIVFLLSGITSALFVIGISIAHLVVRANHVQNGSFLASWRTAGTLVVLVITTMVTVPLMGLMGYHAKLIYLGRTTIEMIRPKYPSDPDGPNKGKPVNPYSYSSKFDNIIGTLCRPMDLYSAIQPHEYAEKDGREENPAFR